MFSFVFFLIWWFVLSAWWVFSFNLFSAWTYKQWNIKIGENYVKDSEVDDTIVGLVIANMMFGEGEYYVTGEKAMQDALKLFATSEALVQVDILDLVTKNEDSARVLDAHLKHIEQTLTKIQSTNQQLREIAQEYVQKANNCLVEKRDGDQLFFQWVQWNDGASTVVGLEMSLEFAPCYITNRIKANAYAYMADKVSTHARILAKRQTLLTNNAQAIVNNTSYLEWNVLEQLIALRNEIQGINRVEYRQVEGLFNMNIFSGERDISSLPSFDRVFLSDTNTWPTYLEPEFNWDWY